jgi:hypothetical protein
VADKEGAMSKSLYEIAIKELQEREEDIRPSDVVLFSEPLRSALNFVIRLGRFSLTERRKTGIHTGQTKQIADMLVERNLFVVSRFQMRKKPITKPASPP